MTDETADELSARLYTCDDPDCTAHHVTLPLDSSTTFTEGTTMPKPRRPYFTRCPAPQGSPGGYHQCIHTRPCPDHPETRWRLLRVPLTLVWAVRPWWPSHLGRAQDRGVAHTPNIYPCKACRHEANSSTPHADVLARHAAATYIPGYEPRRTRTR